MEACSVKCLVTGSEGFIGKNLVKLLEDEGHDVVGADPKIGVPVSHVTDQDWDVIYHLACINQMEAVEKPELNIAVNAEMAKYLSEYAREKGAKFVYTSTASVYGNAEVIPTPVDAKLQPLTDYAVAKLAGEFFVQNSGADWTILRLSNVYGPYQTVDNPYCGVIGKFITQALAGEPLTIIGDGYQTRDWSYVDQVAWRIYKCGLYPTRPLGGIYNVSSGREIPVLNIAATIKRAVGGNSSFEFIGQRPIDGVKRRCLKPSLLVDADIEWGIYNTVKWFRER